MTKNPGFPLKDSTGTAWHSAKPKATLRPIDYARPSDHDPHMEEHGLRNILIAVLCAAVGIFGFVVIFGGRF